MLFAALTVAGQSAGHSAAPALLAISLIVFGAVSVWAAVADARRRIIPNAAVATGCAGWLMLLLAAELAGIDVWAATLQGLASGLLLLAGLLVFAVVFERITGRASMGGGDVKLLAMCGLYLGLSATLIALMAACVLALAGEAMRARRSSDLRPDAFFAFGPYIAVASCAVAVCAAMPAVL